MLTVGCCVLSDVSKCQSCARRRLQEGTHVQLYSLEFLRDNWQEMVTEEIKTLFRKARRQVEKKIWAGKADRDNRTSRREGHKKLAGPGQAQRAPPSLSLWLKADLFKRIVRRLANLPAASAAEHGGANVMRVVEQTCRQARGRRLSASSLWGLTDHWVVIYCQVAAPPDAIFQSEMLIFLSSFFSFFFSCGCYIAMAKYFMSLSLQNVKAASTPMHIELSKRTLSISTGHTNVYGWHGSPFSFKSKMKRLHIQVPPSHTLVPLNHVEKVWCHPSVLWRAVLVAF